jgi:hypothetical protein
MRWLLAVLAVAAVAAFTLARGGGSPPVGPLAVLSTHVTYEASLIDAALPRLPSAQGRVARTVRDVTAAQASHLSALLVHRGYRAAKAEALWSRLVGSGAPAPSRALLYVC